MLKLTNAYEIGRAMNPALAHQQIVGGAWMGISHALYETTEPYYPDRSHGPLDFSQYLMPGPGDIAEMDSVIIERPAANGPYGAKGIGEMTANSPIPAIANAIFDACGVRVTTHADHAGKDPARPRRAARQLQLNPIKRTVKMIKVMSLMKRKDGMSFADFRKWMLDEHVAFARNLPGLKKYTANVLLNENPDAPYRRHLRDVLRRRGGDGGRLRDRCRQGRRRRRRRALLQPVPDGLRGEAAVLAAAS